MLAESSPEEPSAPGTHNTPVNVLVLICIRRVIGHECPAYVLAVAIAHQVVRGGQFSSTLCVAVTTDGKEFSNV